MTAHALARRILEADDDLDISKEIQRLSGTAHPGVEIEVEGNHWNVYRMAFEELRKQGSIYYSDPKDFPEDMTPENRAHWSQFSWDAIPTSPHVDGQFFKTFDEAVKFLANIKWVGEAEEIDPEDIPEPNLDPARELERYTDKPKLVVKNPERPGFSWSGKTFMAEITWDDHYRRPGEERMQPMVTFYDQDEAQEGSEYGQKVSRYYAATIAAHQPRAFLELNGGVPAWTLAPEAVAQVVDWLNQELSKRRGYKLIQNWPFERYESLEDPDNPDLYTNPERHHQIEPAEGFETALREMLKPYYDKISVVKAPNALSRLMPSLTDWRVICQRTTGPLPLANRTMSWYTYKEQVDWPKQIESWLYKAAKRHRLFLSRFRILGRVRSNPIFTFQTCNFTPGMVGENLDDAETPEGFVDRMVKSPDADALQKALWNFHPYGVGYSVTGSHRQLNVAVWTYYPPEERDYFAEQVKTFVTEWLERTKIMTVQSIQMSKWDESRGSAPYTGFNIWINIPFDVNSLGDDEAA